MVIGITGANGFLGRYLTQYLAAAGYDILASVRSEAGKEYFKRKNIDVHFGDMLIRKSCGEFIERIDCVIHLAHSSFPLSGTDDLVDEAIENISPSLHLLEAIRLSKREIKLIYASSGGTVYGNSVSCSPYKETDFCHPTNTYGIQKYTIENYITHYSHVYGVNSTVLRLSNPYGVLLDPIRRQGLIGVVMSRILNDEPVTIYGSSNNIRDYLHLDDMSRAFEYCLSFRGSGEIFNIGAGVGHSVAEILAKIESITGQQLKREYVVDEAVSRLPEWNVLNISKANGILGWSPTITIDAGLKLMCESHGE
jgi:UDP-glucose 4-epimerase